MSSNNLNAFIFAAGRGERLRPLTDQTPKPLLPVQGRPLLAWVLDRLDPLVKSHGLTQVVINAWHLADQVEAFVETQKAQRQFKIFISREEELLGTGGGLKKGIKYFSQSLPLLVMNGDCLWDGPLEQFIDDATTQNQSKNFEATWWLTPEEKDQTAVVSESQRIVKIGSLWRDETTAASSQKTGCFSGIQLIHRLVPKELPEKGCIIRNYWLNRFSLGSRIGASFREFDHWIDIGTSARYAEILGRG